MRWAKSVLILVAALAGMLYSLWSLHGQQSDPGALSVILTLCSALFTWIVADHFATYQSDRENRKLIDGIGERSSEKILNQSKQLWEIEDYAKRHADDAEDEYTSEALLSLRDMLRLVRSSNNTYLGDWEGVVSDPVRQKMKQKIEEQDKQFKRLEGQTVNSDGTTPTGSLPGYLSPQVTRANTKLVDILSQTPKTNTAAKNQGVVVVRLNRESYGFNFTPKLYPNLASVPHDCRARIIDGPEERPTRVGVHAATGMTNDFHIHSKSYETGVRFPPGDYVFEYIVQLEDPNAVDYAEDDDQQALADGSNSAMRRVDQTEQSPNNRLETTGEPHDGSPASQP